MCLKSRLGFNAFSLFSFNFPRRADDDRALMYVMRAFYIHYQFDVVLGILGEREEKVKNHRKCFCEFSTS